MGPAQVREKVLTLLLQVGLDADVADRYPHELSGGMRQRAVIAMALACDPDIIIADEPTSALDGIVQDRVLSELAAARQRTRTSLLYISHDIAVVSRVSDDIGVMYAGKLVEKGPAKDVLERPLHPYTAALVTTLPTTTTPGKPLPTIAGEPPDMVDPPAGCRFHPRCPYATDECRREAPPVVTRDEQWAACWHPLG